MAFAPSDPNPCLAPLANALGPSYAYAKEGFIEDEQEFNKQDIFRCANADWNAHGDCHKAIQHELLPPGTRNNDIHYQRASAAVADTAVADTCRAMGQYMLMKTAP